MQKMLDIANELAGGLYTEYGEVKSKLMKIGRKGAKLTFKLRKQTVEYTDKYKYLDQIMNERNNAEHHIKEIKRMSQVVFQITQTIAGNDNFKWKWKLTGNCSHPVSFL